MPSAIVSALSSSTMSPCSSDGGSYSAAVRRHPRIEENVQEVRTEPGGRDEQHGSVPERMSALRERQRVAGPDFRRPPRSEQDVLAGRDQRIRDERGFPAEGTTERGLGELPECDTDRRARDEQRRHEPPRRPANTSATTFAPSTNGPPDPARRPPETRGTARTTPPRYRSPRPGRTSASQSTEAVGCRIGPRAARSGVGRESTRAPPRRS